MKVYVCYLDYGEHPDDFDHCSPPIVIFASHADAVRWCKKNAGSFEEMEFGKEYLPL